MLDSDLSLKDSLFSELTSENILFCEDNELHGVLFSVLEEFKGTKLDNVFYVSLDICDECCLNEGNYRLQILHDRTDVGTVENAFKLLVNRGLI